MLRYERQGASFLWWRRPSPRPCIRLPCQRVQLRGYLFAEIFRSPWCHRPLLRSWPRVGHFLFRKYVLLAVVQQTAIRYMKLKVLCGAVLVNGSGVTQWGVCQYPWLGSMVSGCWLVSEINIDAGGLRGGPMCYVGGLVVVR